MEPRKVYRCTDKCIKMDNYDIYHNYECPFYDGSLSEIIDSNEECKEKILEKINIKVR